MRIPRIKIEGQGYYHCMSRVVDRRMIMGTVERDKFCSLMRGAEIFCGVHVLTFAVLSNHFHILLEVPERQDLCEAEIIARLPAIYDENIVLAMQAQWASWRKMGLEQLVQEDLERLRARMYDVSAFMKTVKQRFTQWYNRRAGRCGTLWENRFKSVLVEPPRSTQSSQQGVGALVSIAAYIDLNAVRAKIVADPKDYRWCGYGEAVAGKTKARKGLAAALGLEEQAEWSEVAPCYRLLVYEAGQEINLAEGCVPLRAGISTEQVEQVIHECGELTLQQALHCRVRYFSDGVVIGGKAFVDEIFHSHRDKFGSKRKDGARRLRFAAWGGLCSARDLRLAPILVSSV